MSVVKRGNSRYWYIQFQMNGRQVIRSSRTTNKKAAEQMEADLRSKLHAQQYLGVKPSLSVGEALDLHVNSKRGTPFFGGLRSSAKIVCRILGRNRRLDDITTQDLQRFKAVRGAEGVSPQTIKHNLASLRGAIKLAKATDHAVPDVEFPATAVGKQKLRYLSLEEEARLLRELDPNRTGRGLPSIEKRSPQIQQALQDAYDLVVILLDTGARYSEVATLERARVDMENRAINLWRSKVQNESVLFMTDRVHAVLSRRLECGDSRYVFSNKKGGPRGYAAQAIRKAIRRAGLGDCRIHTLRHTHATRLIQSGMSIYEVREVLGHSDIKTTMRYAHLETRHVTAKARDVINRLNSVASSQAHV